MKTIDERSLNLILEWRDGEYKHEAQKTAALQVAINNALKEQDRITREACIEAVTDLSVNDIDLPYPYRIKVVNLIRVTKSD